MVRDYVKISEQDLKLAEEFFENEKHFSEWLLNVFNYYRGKEVKIKTKIVQRYFNNYKKTMDFIINSVKTGKDGGEKGAEIQRVKKETLAGVVVGEVVPIVLDTVPPNSKVEIVNSKVVIEKGQSLEQRKTSFYDTLKPFVGTYSKEMLREFYEYWIEPNKSKTKLRYEGEKYFDTAKRLATWKRNEKQSFGDNTQKPQVAPLPKNYIQ